MLTSCGWQVQQFSELRAQDPPTGKPSGSEDGGASATHRLLRLPPRLGLVAFRCRHVAHVAHARQSRLSRAPRFQFCCLVWPGAGLFSAVHACGAHAARCWSEVCIFASRDAMLQRHIILLTPARRPGAPAPRHGAWGTWGRAGHPGCGGVLCGGAREPRRPERATCDVRPRPERPGPGMACRRCGRLGRAETPRARNPREPRDLQRLDGVIAVSQLSECSGLAAQSLPSISNVHIGVHMKRALCQVFLIFVPQ